jgi:hypothetical protein
VIFWERGEIEDGEEIEIEGGEGGDIQIAQRIIADVKALFTCVPYLPSALTSSRTSFCGLFP